MDIYNAQLGTGQHFALSNTDMPERYIVREQLIFSHSLVQIFISMMIVHIPLTHGALALPKYCGKLI